MFKFHNFVNKLHILILFAVTLFLLGCSSSSEDSSAKPLPIVVGISPDNPVYEFLQDGKIVGIDVDIINAIAKKIGRDIEIKNIDFPGLFPALKSGNIDLIISAISVTSERAAVFGFSKIYADSSVGLLYRGSKIKIMDELADKVIGAQLGSTWEEIARRITQEAPGSTVRTLSNNLVLVEELKSGRIDAIVMEDIQIGKFIELNPELKKFPLPVFRSEFAIATQLNSPLLTDLNKAIDELERDGVIYEIKDKWTR
jgi:polar amino acid transport system substrate-binding protein